VEARTAGGPPAPELAAAAAACSRWEPTTAAVTLGPGRASLDRDAIGASAASGLDGDAIGAVAAYGLDGEAMEWTRS